MTWSKFIVVPALLALIVVGGCRQGSRGADRLAQDTAAAQDQDINSNLTFDNITLEQPDEKGQTLWKVKAKQATYSPDQKIAKVVGPDGDIYQGGKPIYRIQAERGEVSQDGDRILLQGNVLATDLKSGAILRGNQLEWRPKADLLTVRGNVRGSHPDVKLSADVAQASNKKRQIETTGNVVATTEDPKLRLQTEHIIWQMDKKMVIGDRPVQVQRIEGKETTDQANAKQANVNLATKVVTLKQDAQLTFVDPPLQITGNLLSWNVNQKTLVANQPVKVVHRQQQVTLTANQGRLELQPKVAYFTGSVRAIGERNQSQLTADRLTWKIDSQNVEAIGNVVYNQADPPASVKGPKAVGKLDNKTMVVSGGDVVTEIVPQGNNF